MFYTFNHGVEINDLQTSDKSSCGNPAETWLFSIDMGAGALNSRGFVYDADNVQNAVDNTSYTWNDQFREGSCEQILAGFMRAFCDLEIIAGNPNFDHDAQGYLRGTMKVLTGGVYKETTITLPMSETRDLPAMKYGERKPISRTTARSSNDDYDYSSSKC